MRHTTPAAALAVMLGLTLPGLAQDKPLAAGAPSVEQGSVINLQSAKGGEGPDEKGPFANRGGDLAPVLRALQADGVKLTYLGEDGGVKAYLGEAANGRFQAFYVAPDGEHVVAGLLFAAGGANVTTAQVSRMMKRFGDATRSVPGLDASALADIPSEQGSVADAQGQFVDWMKGNGLKMTPFLEKTGGLDGYLVESQVAGAAQGKMQPFYVFPGGKYAAAGVLVRRGGVFVTGLQIAGLQQRFLSDIEEKGKEKATPVMPGSPNPPAAPPPSTKVGPAPAGAAEMGGGNDVPPPPRPVMHAATPAPDTSPIKPTLPSGPISPKPEAAAQPYAVDASDAKSFLDAAHSTVWFTAGVRGLPAVYMVADPQCPFCHEAWRKLKTLVFDRKIQVRVILIAGLKGSDPHVRSILARGDEAARAWLEGEGSIPGVVIKPPPAEGTPTNEEARRLMLVNGGFAEKFHISRTPFLFYTAPDERLYASVGLPGDFDAFLAALR